MVPVGCIEINPHMKFSYQRDQDTLLHNNKFHGVFGNELLVPNIKASYRDFYLRKEVVKVPFHNVIVKNLERVEMTSTTHSLSLEVQKVSVQVSKYQKLYRTDQKLVITLDKNKL